MSDPQRTSDQPFDRSEGYSGQDYTIDQEKASATGQAPAGVADDPRDIPPDNGRRAGADPVTGEVYGSGSGAGGGNAGEDFDSATPSGDSYPLTGGEGTDHVGRGEGMRGDT